MTRREAYRAKLLADDAPDAAISAHLADPSAPAMLKIGKGQIDVAAAVLAHQRSAEELAVEDVTPARRQNAVKTATLLAPVGRPPLAPGLSR